MQRGSFSLLHIKATSSVGQASRDCDSPFWMAPHAGECLAQSGFALADREVRCDRSLEGWWLALSNRKSHPAPGKKWLWVVETCHLVLKKACAGGLSWFFLLILPTCSSTSSSPPLPVSPLLFPFHQIQGLSSFFFNQH